MSLELLECPNCGADINMDLTKPTLQCDYCCKTLLNKAYRPPVVAPKTATYSPMPMAPAPESVAAPAPSASARIPALPATDEEFVELVKKVLQTFDSLYFAPNIPAKKEANARKAYGAALAPDERILAQLDTTTFGGGDDGFIITRKRFGWNNLGTDGQTLTWEALELGRIQLPVHDGMVVHGTKFVPGTRYVGILERLYQLLRLFALRAGRGHEALPYVGPEIPVGARVWAQSVKGQAGRYHSAHVVSLEKMRYEVQLAGAKTTSWELRERVMSPRLATHENVVKYMHVAAKWTDGALYGANLLSIETGGFKVSWDDGTAPTFVPLGEVFIAGGDPTVVPPPIKLFTVGSHVNAQWTDGEYYGAKVVGIQGDSFLVAWDDGARPMWVNENFVRA